MAHTVRLPLAGKRQERGKHWPCGCCRAGWVGSFSVCHRICACCARLVSRPVELGIVAAVGRRTGGRRAVCRCASPPNAGHQPASQPPTRPHLLLRTQAPVRTVASAHRCVPRSGPHCSEQSELEPGAGTQASRKAKVPAPMASVLF